MLDPPTAGTPAHAGAAAPDELDLFAGGPLLRDIGAFARYVIAGPLLLAAELVCLAVLGHVARRFLELLPAAQTRERYAQTVQSVRALLRHPLAEAAVVALAYLLSAAAHQAVVLEHMPTWYRSHADATALSPAGWWHALVSMPLLLMLVLGWLWRLLVWTRFLWLVSRLELSLVSVHPDGSAGLAFVGNSLVGFAPVAAGLGAIVAGAIANGSPASRCWRWPPCYRSCRWRWRWCRSTP